MHLFTEFLVKLFPLYLCMLFGFLMGRWLKVQKQDIANILVFLLLPVITFHGAFTMDVNSRTLSLPVFFFIACSLITFLFLWVGRKLWKDNTGNLLGFASGYGNYGYFALPAAIVLFGKEAESIVIIAGVGYTLYTSTVGYFVTARGNFSVKESLHKTLLLPSIYTLIIGLLLNISGIRTGTVWGIDFTQVYTEFMRDMRGAYSAFGMMLAGIAIAGIRDLKVDWKFTSMAGLAHFIVWPAMIAGFILLDASLLHFYPVLILKIMFLFSLIPVGVNLIAYASQLDVQPEKAAITILVTTVFGMVYIPFMITLFMGYIE
jgi:malate permease and related proteins